MRSILFLLFVFCVLPDTAKAFESLDTSHVCYNETIRQEKSKNIKTDILSAIASVESGRWNENYRANIAWPWTVMAEGKGRYLPTKQQAIQEVLRLKAKGVKNIDVGCMQVNLMWHPDAFKNLEEAFDPKKNVEYAAGFVKRLYDVHGSWIKAATAYHSSLPAKAVKYKKKLTSALKDIKTAVLENRWFKNTAKPVQTAFLSQKNSHKKKFSLPNKSFSMPKRDIDFSDYNRLMKVHKGNEKARRAVAKKFATDWRKKKLAAYMAKKARKAEKAL